MIYKYEFSVSGDYLRPESFIQSVEAGFIIDSYFKRDDKKRNGEEYGYGGISFWHPQKFAIATTIQPLDGQTTYYNRLLGDTSFLLAGLLFSTLKKKYNEWKYDKWIDDSLITNVVIEESQLIIDGMIVLGRAGVNKQWVDYFSFKVDVFNDHVNLNKFSFLFGLVDSPEISYEDFKNNREFYMVRNKKWKYSFDFDLKGVTNQT